MLYDPTPPRPPRQRRPQIPGRTPRSAWPVVGIAAVLLAVAAFFGAMGLAAWILVTGFLLLLTGLYALALHRQSWAGLDTDTQRKVALAGSGVVLAVGAVAATIAAPTVQQEQPTAQDEPAAPPSPEPRPTSRGELLERAPSPQVDVDPPTTPAPRRADDRAPAAEAEAALMNQPCSREGAGRTQEGAAYRCTRDMDGRLVWMDRGSADRIAAARAATERLNREAAAANAESERLRAELDAERRAAQQQAAAEQAAAENARVAAAQAEEMRQAEAERLAEEQAGQPPVTPPPPPETPAPTPTPEPTVPVPPQPPTPPVPTPTPPAPTPPSPTPGPSLAPVTPPSLPDSPERAAVSVSTQSP